ncbi:type VII secretion protein [Mycobacterium sp. ST-F2]|uniref:type VII secretion integral membrane protein EccD n=1 Tax=Mycobacterium sp. ST-F2 TaxID=1490484 RepID=UPI00093F1BD1|nr:type VII secretion integral membrane protein EccD [Mycobacterium sp. ST-F2]OKH85578.1 type VII secretion protein [Mycobacterium sp. ST-F2]
MTLPPSLSELESHSESEQELSRVTVLVGGLVLDVGLPTHVSIAAVINDVIDLANDQVPAHSMLVDVEFDNAEDKWTFARLGGSAIDPSRSLAEAGIYDGDFLVVQEIGVPAAPLLFDDVETNKADTDSRKQWLIDNARTASWFALSIAVGVLTAVLLPRQTVAALVPAVPIAAIAALVLGVTCAAVACVQPYRSGQPKRSAWLAGASMPLIFGGALFAVPGAHGVKALPMALGLTALVALLILLSSGRGRSLYTAVIGIAVLCIPAAVAELVLSPAPRAVGAILATVAVTVVYMAPRTTIMLSKLPVPRVPTAGEPLDDIETQGGTTVEGVNAIGKQVIPTEEGMTERVRRANEYLTGIIAAAALTAAFGCYLAVDVSNGFFWQGTAFSIAVATVLCLRGRSHHDLVQSATLIGAGLLIVLAMIAKTALNLEGWQINSALMLVGLIMLVVCTGLVAPRLEFSPVQRRRVELLEYLAIALVFPLACWIIRLYAFFRELHL